MQLLTYFQNNLSGLISYKHRSLDLPEPPEGIEYCGCGAMESNVFSIIGRRMKHRRANWSVRGGNNLVSLPTLKATGRLRKALSQLVSVALPEKYVQDVITPLSAAGSPQRVGKGYDGFNQAMIPASMPWMKDLCNLKPFSQIPF